MKKIKKILFIIITIFVTISCNSISIGDISESFLGENVFNKTEKEQFLSKLKSYKLEAKISTTKGDINLFLYPEAAPKSVANFVFLAKKHYYDNLNFHRVVPNALIQAGDKVGDGSGNTGYNIEDEVVDWLNFDEYGMLAMAKLGTSKDTNSSQFFLTLNPIPNFNDNYTIIGNVKNRSDLGVAKLIRENDKINSIEITGINVDEFLDNFTKEIKEWNEFVK